ncbi:MAG: hypothetical protein LUH02_07740, partial [Erysipelotrichaceae bacterium]|nr:hypothetical protein [Erysipelotrichaceae bacterium]
IIVGYVFILKTPLVDKQTGQAPVITFDNKNIAISVEDDEDVLFKGVHATDEEDGDLSKEISIESMSTFTSVNTRTVTYVVFDQDNNVTKASRTISYTDYTNPTFSLDGPLVSSSYSTSALTKLIKANSCVDGDISTKIAIKNSTLIDNNQLQVYLSVSDSTGSASYLTLNYYLNNNNNDINITLDEYLIYLEVGEDYDYQGNIDDIIQGNITDNSLKPYVDIDIPDMDEPGIYEVTYSLTRSNGYTGQTQLVVIVTDEEGSYE